MNSKRDRTPDPAGACIPLIISGPPRSGTSLFYNLFDGHSQVSWLIDEGFLFEYLYESNALDSKGCEIMVDSAKRHIKELVFGIRDKQVMPPVEIGYHEPGTGAVTEITIETPWSEEAYRQVLDRAEFENVSDMWQALARACLAGLGQAVRRYCCMKAPDYGRSAIAALDAIPDAKAILVTRDPARSLDSLKRTREMRGEKLLTWPIFALCIADMNAMAQRAQSADPARLLCLRYEDVVTDPEAAMRHVAEWLNIDFEPCLLEPTILGQRWPGASSFSPMQGIEASSAQREIQALDAREIELVNRHLGPFREYFRYDLSETSN